MKWHTLKLNGKIITTNDPDKIIAAYRRGASIERVIPPAGVCGCPTCLRTSTR